MLKARAMLLWRLEGLILESLEDKRMCKDPFLDVRHRAWATRVMEQFPGISSSSGMQRGFSEELITPHLLDSAGPRGGG